MDYNVNLSCGKYLLIVGKSNKYLHVLVILCQLIVSMREAKYDVENHNLWSKHEKGKCCLVLHVIFLCMI